VVIAEDNRAFRVARYTNPSRDSPHVRVMSIDSAIDDRDSDLTARRLLQGRVMKAHVRRHMLPHHGS
jgi:hypothetical protein